MANKASRISVGVIDHSRQKSRLTYVFQGGFWASVADFFTWDLSKHAEMKTLVGTYSHAQVESTSKTDTNNYFDDIPDNFFGTIIEKGFDLVDQFAVMTFRDDKGGVHKMTMPAPKSSMFELVQGAGWRVTQTAGADIADKLSQALNVTLYFQQGYLDGKK